MGNNKEQKLMPNVDLPRLKGQLMLQKQKEAIHQNPRLLKEIAFYPAHDARRETEAYKAVHKKMVVDMDLPCLICGVKHSSLQDKKKNIWGAKQMETHHHVIEWALANAIDVDKFNQNVLPHLKHKHNKPEYNKLFTADQVRDWVDHSEDNLWVLCDVHHRAKYFGIHEISQPIWGPQDLLRDDFEDYARTTIAQIKAEEKTTGKSNGKSNGKKKPTGPKAAAKKTPAKTKN
jgi:hypothetical protein